MTASAPDHSAAPEFSYGFGLYLLFRLFPDTKNTQDHGSGAMAFKATFMTTNKH
jgi:hypothetical protein